MSINVTEVFCEILGGLSALMLIALIADLTSISTFSEVYPLMANNLTLTVGFSYLLGLVVDAISLAIGEWFLDKWLRTDEPTQGANQAFLKNATAHVLKYRDTEWAYFSAYRNLFLILIPGIFVAAAVTAKYIPWYWAVMVVGGVGVLLELALLKSMKVLLGIYYEITKSIGWAT